MRTAKMWVAAVGAVVTALSAAFADDVFDGNDVVAVATTVVSIIVTMWGVYKTRNTPETPTIEERRMTARRDTL